MRQTSHRSKNVAIFVLVIATISFLYLYLASQVELRNDEKIIASQKINTQVLAFSELFFDKVLQGTKTVSFDDRLQLENSVRALNDEDIFSSWTKFTNAKDQNEVQKDFYNLFQLLLKKISY